MLTLLVLPRSGEALAFEHKQGRTAPPQIHRLDPVVSAPVPGTYRDATRTAMLRTMIEARQVGDLPEDVVEIAEPAGEETVPDVCPAYRYTGRLRLRSGQVRATGHIYGERGEDRVPLDLSRAGRLIDYWLNQAELLYLAEMFQAVCREIGCSPADATARRAGASHWAFEITSAGARDLANRGMRLCRSGGLELVSPDQITKIEVVASFEPADPDAAITFAVDAATDMLEELPPDSLTPADLSQAVVTAYGAYQIEAARRPATRWRRGCGRADTSTWSTCRLPAVAPCTPGTRPVRAQQISLRRRERQREHADPVARDAISRFSPGHLCHTH